MHVRLVDIDPALEGAAAAIALTNENRLPDQELEGRAAPDGRYAARLCGPAFRTGTGRSRGATSARRACWNSLSWRAASLRDPGPGESAYRRPRSGLNFRDVMWAQGFARGSSVDGFAGPTLGLECAGLSRLGPRRLRLRARRQGHGVRPLGPGRDSGHRRPRHCAPHLRFELRRGRHRPGGYLTVVYALGAWRSCERGKHPDPRRRGGGRPGGDPVRQAPRRDRHRNAGIARQARGADQLGSILSRLPRFGLRGEVMAATDGKGVDVVLNSLSGEAWKCPFGCSPRRRFCELGKRDFYADPKVGLRPLRANASISPSTPIACR